MCFKPYAKHEHINLLTISKFNESFYANGNDVDSDDDDNDEDDNKCGHHFILSSNTNSSPGVPMTPLPSLR